MDNMNKLLLTLVIVHRTTVLSYNQPKFCPDASWNPYATTFQQRWSDNREPYALFIDANNTVYAASDDANHVHTWISGSVDVSDHPFENVLSNPRSLFVTRNGDIFADNGAKTQTVKWLVKTKIMSIIYVENSCYGLFIDPNNTIYCSIRDYHKVVKKSLNGNNNPFTITAGNGSSGSGSSLLNYPCGIFVDIKSNLYVADCRNNRIQLFQPGNLTGTTVVGNGTTEIKGLNCPTGVVLDTDGYLFIVDSDNHRIIGSGRNGFRCLVGCDGGSGTQSNQLASPRSLSFDSYGNIFVADTGNKRIQKFALAKNSCNETTTTLALSTSTVNAGSSPNVIYITSTVVQSTSGDSTSAHDNDLLPSTKNTESREISSISSSTITATTVVEAPQVETTTTAETTISKTPPPHFVTPICQNFTSAGVPCDELQSLCHLTEPCQNGASCTDNKTSATGYTCLCLPYFDGPKCQNDRRPCKPDTCWNNGTCVLAGNETFECQCSEGWRGSHCQAKIDYCENETCSNNGLCRPLFMNFTCVCFGDGYSGRHCEIVATRIKIYKFVSKSLAYIAIIALASVATFIVVMDILKYCFGIDPVHEERERIRRTKRMKKRKPVIQRFVYVNAPPKTTTETTV